MNKITKLGSDAFNLPYLCAILLISDHCAPPPPPPTSNTQELKLSMVPGSSCQSESFERREELFALNLLNLDQVIIGCSNFFILIVLESLNFLPTAIYKRLQVFRILCRYKKIVAVRSI